jgi:hypothetical protein
LTVKVPMFVDDGRQAPEPAIVVTVTSG